MKKHIGRYQSRLLAALAVLGFAAIAAQGQTVITGPNITTSTWSPSGNPYIVAANCTVPSGNTLTIQPGTIVWMGEGVSLTGNGKISAVGTSGQRITFQAISGGGNWNTIIINNTVGTNQFEFCDFSNAINALDFGLGLTAGTSQFNEVMYCTFSDAIKGITFHVNSINDVKLCSFENVQCGIYMTVSGDNTGSNATRTQAATIMNCSFKNCFSQAIYGQAIGRGIKICGAGCQGYSQNAVLNTAINNCSFNDVDTGCLFYLAGSTIAGYGTGYGNGNVQIVNNCFYNSTNTAMRFSVGSYAGGGAAGLINNTIVSAGSGVVSQDPWDATIQNNIFDSCTSAVSRSGSLSASVSYNDFFGNTANFSGYPVTYGQVLLTNRNGTPSDVLYNIFQDPLFVATDDFHLQAGSSCIDAGEGSAANYDSYFPPSMGGTYNDIGAYGGPGAGRWLDVAPYEPYVVPVAAIDLYVGVTVNPPEPGHYRLEYSTDLLDAESWTQLTNMDLTTEPVIYYELPSEPQRFYRAVLQ